MANGIKNPSTNVVPVVNEHVYHKGVNPSDWAFASENARENELEALELIGTSIPDWGNDVVDTAMVKTDGDPVWGKTIGTTQVARAAIDSLLGSLARDTINSSLFLSQPEVPSLDRETRKALGGKEVLYGVDSTNVTVGLTTEKRENRLNLPPNRNLTGDGVVKKDTNDELPDPRKFPGLVEGEKFDATRLPNFNELCGRLGALEDGETAVLSPDLAKLGDQLPALLESMGCRIEYDVCETEDTTTGDVHLGTYQWEYLDEEKKVDPNGAKASGEPILVGFNKLKNGEANVSITDSMESGVNPYNTKRLPNTVKMLVVKKLGNDEETGREWLRRQDLVAKKTSGGTLVYFADCPNAEGTPITYDELPRKEYRWGDKDCKTRSQGGGKARG